jgi:DNA-binding response OmpR family regulator
MPDTQLSKPTILVVDDENEILNLVTKALHKYGFDVLTVDEGVKAVEMYLHYRDWIDFVLLDVQMKKMDGVRTLFELRRINPVVRVAFMSATPNWFAAAQLLRLGVVHVFDKPFLSLKYLAETLKELVGRNEPK